MKKITTLLITVFLTANIGLCSVPKEVQPFEFCSTDINGACHTYARKTLDHIENYKANEKYYIKVFDKTGKHIKTYMYTDVEAMYQDYDDNVQKIFVDSHYKYCWKDSDYVWDKAKVDRPAYYLND